MFLNVQNQEFWAKSCVIYISDSRANFVRIVIFAFSIFLSGNAIAQETLLEMSPDSPDLR